MTIRGIGAKGWGLVAATAAVVMLLVTATAVGGPADDALPDLVSDAPGAEFLQTYVDDDGTTRLLLRFHGYVHNAGAGPLELRGSGNVNAVMSTVAQRIYRVDGTGSRDVTSAASMRFETADGHNHFHLRAAMEYALYDSTKSAAVAPSMKVGFCLLDSERVSGAVPLGYPDGTNCARNTPTAPLVVMGVSPGWRDVYNANLAFQWVDVSDVAPGSYWLGARSDPSGVMVESNEGNNGWSFKSMPSLVPGWVARSATLTATPGIPRTIALAATAYAAPGPISWEILSTPRLGSLDRQVGVPFPGNSVVYTPRPGTSGVDTFRIQARDSLSAFPRRPVQATVSVNVSGSAPVVTISGAPSALTTSTAAQLSATVVNDPPAVTWSVDGVPGGNATSGTITSTGLYTAPANVPASGSVVVRAASAHATGEAAIAIQAPAPPAPAPSPGQPASPAPPPTPVASPPAAAPSVVVQVPVNGTPTTKRVANPLARPLLSARGTHVLVGLRSARAGTLKITVLRGSRRLGGCVLRTSALRSVTCAVKLARGAPLRGIGVRVGLHVSGKLVAMRTARVSGVSAISRNGLRTLYCTPA
jgi:hypothetical protein